MCRRKCLTTESKQQSVARYRKGVGIREGGRTKPSDVDCHLKGCQVGAGFEEAEAEVEFDAEVQEADSSFVSPDVCGDPPEPLLSF